MIISKIALEKIKKIIENRYHSLLVSLVGRTVLSEDELTALKRAGYSVDNHDSLLSLIYYNNILNDLTSTTGPITVDEMKAQQRVVPMGPNHVAAEEHLNENFAQAVEKIKASVQASIEGIIREYNFTFRNNILQNPERAEAIEGLIKQSTVAGLKNALRDYSGDAARDWTRVAITETANALGLGSIDRVVTANKDEDLSQVYVYRIPVNDAALCKHCRRFYLDGDGTPAIYRLSTLLGNGTNYGKKSSEWKAVAGATHPNDRESGVMELRPGWRVAPGGKLEFIGRDSWRDYVSKKLRD